MLDPRGRDRERRRKRRGEQLEDTLEGPRYRVHGLVISLTRQHQKWEHPFSFGCPSISLTLCRFPESGLQRILQMTVPLPEISPTNRSNPKMDIRKSSQLIQDENSRNNASPLGHTCGMSHRDWLQASQVPRHSLAASVRSALWRSAWSGCRAP